MSDISSRRSPSRTGAGRAALILIAAIVVAVLLNAVVAAVAVAAGAPSDYGPLTLPAYATFTIVGVLAGWVGWLLITRRARDPRRILRALVPVVVVLSLVPDVLLMVARFIPGTTTSAAIGLMAMHLVVVLVAVPAFALITRRATAGAPETTSTAPAPTAANR
jgi:hypothetical protein